VQIAVGTVHVGCRTLRLSAALSATISAIAHKYGVEVPTTLLAAFFGLLWRYTSTDDITIALADIPDLDGFVADPLGNAVFLRTDLGDDPSFRDILTRIDRALAQGTTKRAHADERDTSFRHNALPNVSFS